MSGFDREKHLRPLIIGVVGLLLLVGIWSWLSYQDALVRQEKKAASARKELHQFHELLQEYRGLQAELKSSAGQGGGVQSGNLIAAVEEATQKIGARSQLLYVRPQPDKPRGDMVEEGVEIRLEGLQLGQLVELLFRFEANGSMLKVGQLRIKPRYDTPELLDTVMVLSRFREKR